jgi:hypothetical protein
MRADLGSRSSADPQPSLPRFVLRSEAAAVRFKGESQAIGGRHLDMAGCAAFAGMKARSSTPCPCSPWQPPTPEAARLSRFLSTAPEGETAAGRITPEAKPRKDLTMTKIARSSRASARVIPLRKGTTLEMIRLACPDTAQAQRISESFGLAILDSDGIRDLHERVVIGTADALRDGLSDRAMQIHLQRIVGAYVGSAHGAGQFYSRAVTEAREATAKLANDSRDEDRDGPVGFDSQAQRKREFAADMDAQAATRKKGRSPASAHSDRAGGGDENPTASELATEGR